MAERQLARLLATLAPRLDEREWVFVELPMGLAVDALATFREAEGRSAVVRREDADAHGLAYDYVAAWIELTVESDLAAVGMTAAISAALAEAGLSCNVVAALRHDHLFVPFQRAADAVTALDALTRASCTPP